VPANGPIFARNGGLREGCSASKCGTAAQLLPNESPEQASEPRHLARSKAQEPGPEEGRLVVDREQSARLGSRRGECCSSSIPVVCAALARTLVRPAKRQRGKGMRVDWVIVGLAWGFFHIAARE